MKKKSFFINNKRKAVGTIARQNLYIKYNGCCAYCAVKVSFEEGTASVDHFVPLAKGGKDQFNNYVLSCKPCNSAKADFVGNMDEVKAYIKKELVAIVERNKSKILIEVNRVKIRRKLAKNQKMQCSCEKQLRTKEPFVFKVGNSGDILKDYSAACAKCHKKKSGSERPIWLKSIPSVYNDQILKYKDPIHVRIVDYIRGTF